MSEFFGRALQVAVGGSLIETDLRHKFKVEKKRGTKRPDSCVLDIYNMNPATYDRAIKRGALLVLDAGYETEELPTLFVGEIKLATRSRQGANIIAHMEANAITFTLSNQRITVSRSGKGSTLDVVNEVVRLASGVARTIVRVTEDVLFNAGFSLSGPFKNVMDKLANTMSADWWLDNGDLYFVQQNQDAGGGAILLNQDTGMIGIPTKARVNVGPKKSQRDKPGWYVRSLLQGGIRQGRLVNIQSTVTAEPEILIEAINVVHEGDTDAQDWYTTVQGIDPR